MRVLGVDPGYRHLGLAVIETEPLTLSYSQTVVVGTSDAPQSYTHTLVPYLNNIQAEFHFEAIGTETPPFIEGQIQTTAMLHRVFAIIETWAFMQAPKIEIRYRAPMALKAAARRLLGIADPKENGKAMMRRALIQIVGASGKTDHENDAALAAIASYTDALGTARPAA